MRRIALSVWLLLGVFAVLTFVTYARLPPEALYNVSREGLVGGASRTLVFLNFPGAFIAIGVLLVGMERLQGGALWLARIGIALCAVAAVPGVLDQSDLDARWINAVPALGVAIAVVVSVLALREDTPARPAGRFRIPLAVTLALLTTTWIFAEAGFFAPDPIYADEIGAGETGPAVHRGGHHGTYGVLMGLSALALSRVARRAVTSGLLALMLAYGTTIAVEDFWHEEIDKPDIVDWKFPSVLEPQLEWAWLGIVVAAAAIELLWFRPERATRAATAPP